MENNVYVRRMDETLRHEVEAALAADPRTSAFELRLGVLNAIVHLGGEVPSLADWQKVEQVAAGVPGVRGVVNRVTAPGAPSPSRTIQIQLEPKEKRSAP